MVNRDGMDMVYETIIFHLAVLHDDSIMKPSRMLIVSTCLTFSDTHGRVCLSDDNFWKPWRKQFISAHPVYLQEIRVKFVYESHWVKVTVTGAKQVKNPYSRNVKLRSAITPIL